MSECLTKSADRPERAHYGLAVYCARRFFGRGVPREELIGEAEAALLWAAARFDAHRGVRFSTYAIPFVLGALLYAAYAACTGAFSQGAAAVGGVIAEGMTCGAVATVIGIICDKVSAKEGPSVRAACVQTLVGEFCAITEQQAEEIAAAFLRDADEARSLLTEAVGESAAQSLFPLLERALHTLE